MGYVVKSKKFTVTLNEEQQQKMFDIWMNPSEGLKESNWSVNLLYPYFKQENCTDVKGILDMIGISYEEKKKGLKLKAYKSKWRHERNLFDAVAHVITPGEFMTFRGEDGAFIGWFFNGTNILDYGSYDELEKLSKTFEMKKSLDNQLPVNEVSKVKRKI
jgi:hypothetical protein